MPLELLSALVVGILVAETAGIARLRSNFAPDFGLLQSLKNANSVTAIAAKVVGYGSALLIMILFWSERESAWPVPAIGMVSAYIVSIWHYRASNRVKE